MGDAVAAVQAALGYEFADPELLRRALVHSSFAAENEGVSSNERLEFLGDAVLQLAVTGYIHERHPDLGEGEMAKLRAGIVAEPALAGLARRFGLGEALLLGKGEEATGGRGKPSILSDAVEAVLGALYLDAGFDEARRIILHHWSPLIAERVSAPGSRDYKTRLQELLAKRGIVPEYRLDEAGPDHAKVFTAVVYAGDSVAGSGAGSSKKRAQQAAAREALEALDGG